MLPGYEKDSLGYRGLVDKLDLCGEYRSSSSDYDRSVCTHDRFVISKFAFDENEQHRTAED